MDEEAFWQIIDTSRERACAVHRDAGQDFMDVHEQALAEELRKLSPEQLVQFDDRFWMAHRQAYRWDLWAAAYWLEGGGSDDGFIDFRSCLISLGTHTFYAVLEEPDLLAEIVDRSDVPFMQSEGFQYVASRVYKEMTGRDTWPKNDNWTPPPTEPAGERFDFDDEEEMARRLPRIVAKYPEGME